VSVVVFGVSGDVVELCEWGCGWDASGSLGLHYKSPAHTQIPLQTSEWV